MKYLSWKTSAAGISAIIVAVFSLIVQPLTHNDPATVPNYEVAITAILAGIGLLTARDNDKTSEETGAKVGEKPRPSGE